MKILNDRACNFKLNWIELNPIQIQNTCDANWCIRYCKFACDFGVDKNKNFEKTQIWKIIFLVLFTWVLAKQILVLKLSKGQLMESQVVLPTPLNISMNNCH